MGCRKEAAVECVIILVAIVSLGVLLLWGPWWLEKKLREMASKLAASQEEHD
jgi:hypothetical protein